MPASPPSPRIISVQPLWAIEGGRVTIVGENFALDTPQTPEVLIGREPARLVHASSRALAVIVPSGLEGGRTPVRVDTVPGETAFIDVGRPIATGLHQVDNPVFDDEGNLYLTYSGARGQQTPVSIFRVGPNGMREPFVSGIVNATSMALDAERRLHVSSRFEGTVYRINGDGSFEPVATDLGIACGIAFGPDNELYVGDRSGTVFRVGSSGRANALASLPASVAAFHLAMGPDEHLYVSGPTLSPSDDIYRISRDGQLEVFASGFGRPQGLAFDGSGSLYAVEALAGSSAVCKVETGGAVSRVLSARSLVGLAFHPSGGLAVASNETAYHLAVNIRGLRRQQIA